MEVMRDIFQSQPVSVKSFSSGFYGAWTAFLFCGLLAFDASAQRDSTLVYDPLADAGLQVQDAVKRAAAGNKHVVLMIGGNWCRWCLMFEKFRTRNTGVDSAIRAGFIWQHVNYSKENKNSALMSRLEFPQRFGFPVFVILDGTGKRLHTQNSAYMEEGEGYGESKVLEFLRLWSPEALDPDNY